MFGVDPVRDYLRTRGLVRGSLATVKLAVYVAGERDKLLDPVDVRGIKDAPRTEMVGDVKVTRVTWTITSLTADLMLDRPSLLSQIASRGETWRIDAITASPLEGRIFVCQCTLVETGK